MQFSVKLCRYSTTCLIGDFSEVSGITARNSKLLPIQLQLAIALFVQMVSGDENNEVIGISIADKINET